MKWDQAGQVRHGISTAMEMSYFQKIKSKILPIVTPLQISLRNLKLFPKELSQWDGSLNVRIDGFIRNFMLKIFA